MPTQIATLGRERTIATLARKVYKITGRNSVRLQRQAEAALLRANPQLKTTEGFANGAAVLVPNIEGLQLSDTVTVAKVDAAGLTDETSLRLKGATIHIEESFQRAEKNTQVRLDQLNDRNFRAQIRRSVPDAEGLVAKSREQLEKSRVENIEKRSALQTAISDGLKNIEILQKLADRARTG